VTWLPIPVLRSSHQPRRRFSAPVWAISVQSTRLDYSPVVVASAGDVNGDGYGDFPVSSTFAHSGAGVVHLYLGLAAPSAGDWDGASSRRIDLGDAATEQLSAPGAKPVVASASAGRALDRIGKPSSYPR
jgi:hypothetical protein